MDDPNEHFGAPTDHFDAPDGHLDAPIDHFDGPDGHLHRPDEHLDEPDERFGAPDAHLDANYDHSGRLLHGFGLEMRRGETEVPMTRHEIRVVAATVPLLCVEVEARGRQAAGRAPGTLLRRSAVPVSDSRMRKGVAQTASGRHLNVTGRHEPSSRNCQRGK